MSLRCLPSRQGEDQLMGTWGCLTELRCLTIGKWELLECAARYIYIYKDAFASAFALVFQSPNDLQYARCNDVSRICRSHLLNLLLQLRRRAKRSVAESWHACFWKFYGPEVSKKHVRALDLDLSYSLQSFGLTQWQKKPTSLEPMNRVQLLYCQSGPTDKTQSSCSTLIRQQCGQRACGFFLWVLHVFYLILLSLSWECEDFRQEMWKYIGRHIEWSGVQAVANHRERTVMETGAWWELLPK